MIPHHLAASRQQGVLKSLQALTLEVWVCRTEWEAWPAVLAGTARRSTLLLTQPQSELRAANAAVAKINIQVKSTRPGL